MKYFYILFIIGWLIIPSFSRAQVSLPDSSISMTLVVPGYSLQVPEGDLKNRFGINSNVGLNIIYKNRSRWFADVQGCFVFGSKVKQTGLFSHLVTSLGEIVGTDGKYADVRVLERGYYVTLALGKMLTSNKPNPNCGFFIAGGGGFLQHKIRIEDKRGVVPSLQGDYKKGYDRLSNGFCLRQSVGYIYISNHRLVNFYGAIEGIEAFTSGRRSFNFDDGKADVQHRTDILLGLRIGWILPIYRAAPEKYYLY